MDIFKYEKIYVGYTMTVSVYTKYMTTSNITTCTLKTTSENRHIHVLYVIGERVGNSRKLHIQTILLNSLPVRMYPIT